MICTVPCTGSVLREHSTCMAHRHHDHLHTASTRPGLLVYAFVYPTGLDGTIGDLVLLRGLHSHGRSTLAHPSSIALINFDASVRQEHNSSQDRPLPGSHKVRLRNRLSLAVLLGSRNLPGSVTVRNCISLNGLPLPLRCLSLAVHFFFSAFRSATSRQGRSCCCTADCCTPDGHGQAAAVASESGSSHGFRQGPIRADACAELTVVWMCTGVMAVVSFVDIAYCSTGRGERWPAYRYWNPPGDPDAGDVQRGVAVTR